jgi:hypothetical protein
MTKKLYCINYQQKSQAILYNTQAANKSFSHNNKSQNLIQQEQINYPKQELPMSSQRKNIPKTISCSL